LAYGRLENTQGEHYPSIEAIFPEKQVDGETKREIQLTEDDSIDITKGFNKETLTKLLNFLLGIGPGRCIINLVNQYSTLKKAATQLSEISLRDSRVGYNALIGFQ